MVNSPLEKVRRDQRPLKGKRTGCKKDAANLLGMAITQWSIQESGLIPDNDQGNIAN
jgi:hypothetical protein